MLVVPDPAALEIGKLQAAAGSEPEQVLQGCFGAVKAGANHGLTPLRMRT